MDDENLPPLRQREAQQQRKMAKPLMEKRRRERINNCLDQLKSLLIEVTKKEEEEENSYRSKLEKADILEMTVNYLKTVKRQKLSSGSILQTSNDSTASIHSKYVAGFRECAKEVVNYLDKVDGMAPVTRNTLIQHLTSHLQQNESAPPRKNDQLRTLLTQSYRSHSPLASSTSTVNTTLPDLPAPNATPMVSYPVQLIPAKLATGETVYVLANTINYNNNNITLDGAMADQQSLKISTPNGQNSPQTGNYEAISPVASPEISLEHRQRLNINEAGRNILDGNLQSALTLDRTIDLDYRWAHPAAPKQEPRRHPSANDAPYTISNQHHVPLIRLPGPANGEVGDQSNMWRPW